MMTTDYDYVVVGIGGHGSAALAHLAKRGGHRVLGLERFPRVSHAHGSSHGRSRIIRQAYFEAPQYVPLLQRSFALWRELQAETGEAELLTMTGGLMIGKADSTVVSGTLASVRTHSLPHEVLTAEQIRERFPAFQPSQDEIGIFETEAGVLIPELCVSTHCAVAESHGAELRFEEPLLSWSVEEEAEGGGRVVVVTPKGQYTAKKICLAVGAWAPELYGKEIEMPLEASRRVLYWFEPKEATCVFDKHPVYIWDLGAAGNFYGFPKQDGPPGGVKVAMHYVDPQVQTSCTPETIDRVVSQKEEQAMRDTVKEKLPLLAGQLVATATCMYTNTPDEHFLIDWHPRPSSQERVLLASPCSGHGFKLCSVIGEIIADLLTTGQTSHDIDLFRFHSSRLGEGQKNAE